jgi:adenylate cyclase
MIRYWVTDELPSIKKAGWLMDHGIGIDTGEALVVRGGIRNNSDLIAIGAAPNVAAKLSSIRDKYSIYATEEAYLPMSWAVSYKDRPNGQDSICMWKDAGTTKVGGRTISLRGSNYAWAYGDSS